MKKITLLTIIILLPAAISFAKERGNEGSGGGYAVVCRDANHQITSAKLLDIDEAQTQVSDGGYGCNVPDTNDSAASQDEKNLAVAELLRNAHARMHIRRPLIADQIEAGIQDLRDPSKKRLKFEPTNTSLVPPEDYGSVHLYTYPIGCGPEPVGHYTRDGTLHIDQSIFDKMSSTSQAGLWRHESIYAFERSLLKNKTSESSRGLNAQYLDTEQSCSFDDAGFSPDEDSLTMEKQQPDFKSWTGNTNYSCDLTQAPVMKNSGSGNIYYLDAMTFSLPREYPSSNRIETLGSEEFIVSVQNHQLYKKRKVSAVTLIEGVRIQKFGEDQGQGTSVSLMTMPFLQFGSDNDFTESPNDVVSLFPFPSPLMEGLPKGMSYFKSGSLDRASQVITLIAHDGTAVTCNPQ